MTVSSFLKSNLLNFFHFLEKCAVSLLSSYLFPHHVQIMKERKKERKREKERKKCAMSCLAGRTLKFFGNLLPQLKLDNNLY
jgi:hypothetical protein